MANTPRRSQALLKALGAAIELAPAKERDALAVAFQQWVEAQSAWGYGRLRKHGLLGEIIETINEASDARVTIEAGVILIDDAQVIR